MVYVPWACRYRNSFPVNNPSSFNLLLVSNDACFSDGRCRSHSCEQQESLLADETNRCVSDGRNIQRVTTQLTLWTAGPGDAMNCTCLRIADMSLPPVVQDNKSHLIPQGTNVKRPSCLFCLSFFASVSFSLFLSPFIHRAGYRDSVTH